MVLFHPSFYYTMLWVQYTVYMYWPMVGVVHPINTLVYGYCSVCVCVCVCVCACVCVYMCVRVCVMTVVLACQVSDFK